MSKHSRSGGKFTGNHTSLIPLASLVCDIAERSSAVTKISPGFIRAGIGSTGTRRVKIQEINGHLLLSVRDTSSHQEVHMYTTDTARATKAIINGLKESNISVSTAKLTAE